MRALSVALVLGCSLPVSAQDLIEDVIVERYYVSDANDATDTNGGTLVEGSVTYRVFIDLCEGCALRSVYGDEDHSISIQSTSLFFNHLDRGRVYGHAITNGALDEGTVPLDSWLAMGSASNQKRAVVKQEDDDGSIVGGANNDGGSAAIAGGLLVNADASALPVLTERDGLVPLASGATALPPNFNVSGDDPTEVFGDMTMSGSFVSNTFRMASTGVTGATATNRVLLAQLTTTGDLSFCLNVEVQTPDGEVRKFVCSDDVLLSDETPNGLLVYPPQCGCTDPNFLEYDPAAGCDDGSCMTGIIFGCLDTTACNFDANTNFNVPQLCCYGPGNCNGLDISLVCSDVGIEEQETVIGVQVGPNPFRTDVWVDLSVTSNSSVEFVLYDALGSRVWDEVRVHRSGLRHELTLSDVPAGVYHLIVLAPQGVAFQKLVKQ
ncbi:MAG: T9SS type A sorting domain-containing protein [Flavobacteriales bacterium]